MGRGRCHTLMMGAFWRACGALFVTASLLAAPARLRASDDPSGWRTFGPVSGAVLSLALDPSDSTRLYAGSARGSIFRSADGGGSWRAASLPFAGVLAEVRDLVVDPLTPSIVHAATSAGVFKSADSGVTWAPTRLQGRAVYALAIDPVTPSTLYAATADDALYKTTDGGGTWLPLATLVANRSVTAVTVSQRIPSTLYAGVERGKVFRSVDRGVSWAQLGAEGIGSNEFRGLLLDPLTPSTLFAYSERGVFRSADGGVTFSAMNNGLTSTDVTALEQDPLNPATLYAWADGVFKSVDGGRTWARSGLSGSGAVLAVDPREPSTVFAGGDGVRKSRDGAVSWQPANLGLSDSIISAVAVHPRKPSVVYAGGNDVFKSVDGGGSWRALRADLPSFVTALAIDPIDPTTVYAGTGSGVYRSNDEGGRWEKAGPERVITALTANAGIRTVVYAGTADQGVLKSTDGGTRWTRVNSELTEGAFVNAIVAAPGAASVLLIGTQKSFYGSAFRSRDGGSTWAAIPVPDAPTQRLDVQAVVVDPQFPEVVSLGTSAGLFRSADDGATWGPDLLGGRSVTSLAVNPAEPAILYAGTSSDGVFVSTNAGRTWEAFNSGLTSGNINSLAINPLRPTTVYAGTAGSGVFVVGQLAPCDGDCNNDLEVTVDELLIMVNIAAGTSPASQCTPGDLDGDRTITVDEILAAVTAGLFGCSASAAS